MRRFLLLTLLFVTASGEARAQFPVDSVLVPHSIYNVETTYMEGNTEKIALRIVIEFAHAPGTLDEYRAFGWREFFDGSQGPDEFELNDPAPEIDPSDQFPIEIAADSGNLVAVLFSYFGLSESTVEEARDDIESRFRASSYPWQVYAYSSPRFWSHVRFDPELVAKGKEFEAQVIVNNWTGSDITNIVPTGPPVFSSPDGARASVVSGPVPEMIPSLTGSLARDTLRYVFEAEKAGSLFVEVPISGIYDKFIEESIDVTWRCDVFPYSNWCEARIADALEVNSTDDDADQTPGDGLCDTGGLVFVDEELAEECTLRAALQEAVASGATSDELQEITFDIDGVGPFLISPGTPLPTITADISLDATTQPGFVDVPIVQVDGSAAGEGAAGLTITGDDVTVKGLMITRFGSHGIHVVGGQRGLLESLIVGSDAAGSEGLGNGGDGIHISGGSDLTIGSEEEAGKRAGAGSGAINIGSVISVGNLLNGLYAVNESNAALIRSDVHAVEAREGTASKGGGSASQAISINLNVNNLIVGSLGLPSSPTPLPNGLNGICLRGISDAFFNRVQVSDAEMHAFEITASQRIAVRRMIAGLRQQNPQLMDHVGRIQGNIFQIFESLHIEIGSGNADEEPIQGVAAEGWFMEAEDSEDVMIRNVMAGLSANMASVPNPMRALMRNQAGGISLRNLLRAQVGFLGVPTILANNGGNPMMPQAGLMATGPLMEQLRALNLHIGTTPSALPGIGNLGSGVVLADGIKNAELGGENPFERIVSAGNMGYGFLLRDLGSDVPTKSGEAIQIAGITRAVTDMVPTPSGDLSELSNALSGVCFLRARGIFMDMFSIGPSGRHGIESIDSGDLEILAGSIGSMFEQPVQSMGDLMGPTENGFSITGGSNISAGGPLGLGAPVAGLMNIFINDVGGRAVSAEGVEMMNLVSMGIGVAPPGSVMSPAISGALGSRLEAVIVRGVARAHLNRLLLKGNGNQSESGIGAIFAESSGVIELTNSIIGGLTESGAPDRPNVGTSMHVDAVDSMKIALNKFLGGARGLTTQMSSVLLEGNEFRGHTGDGGSGHAVKQTGGTLDAVQNWMSDNAGPAVVVGQMQDVLLRFNDITNNLIGVLNEDAGAGNGPAGPGKSATPESVLAPDNWWGDASGPGGEGPGSGDAISAGVIADSWLSSANGIVVSPEQRVVEAPLGTELVIPIRFATPSLAEDEIDVTVTDERGWITSQTTYSVDVAGPEGGVRELELTVSTEGVNRVTIRAVSSTDPALDGEAVIVLTEPGGTVPLDMPVAAGSDVLDADGADVFTVGGEIILNPGGANEETATIAGFGSILLGTPLRFDHVAGEILAPANQFAVDREAESADVVPSEWGMDVYPNPVRKTLHVSVDAPATGESSVELYDVLGRRVSLVSDGVQPAGHREIMLDIEGLTPGVYVVHGLVGGRTLTAMVTIVR